MAKPTASSTKAPMTAVKGAVVIYQIQDKNMRPTMKNLYRYIINKYSPNWRDIGIELDLDLDLLDIIGKDHPLDSVACLRQTLDRWLHRNPDATWKSLEVALTNVNRAKLGLDPVDDIYESEQPYDKDKVKLQILQSLSKAREDGCLIKVRYGKVLICGAGEAGKTNFLNLLMEENFQPVHISTEVANPKQVTIAMKAQVSKNDKNKKIVFTKMDVDSEIDQLKSYLPNKYTKQSDFTQGSDVQKIYTIAEDMISNALVDNADSDEEILLTEPVEKVWDILTFMDTGGQPQFISMLPAVNKFAMITFIVHKMTGGKLSLIENVVSKHRNEIGKDSCKPRICEYTHHQLIKTLMSYASNVLLPEKEFLNTYKTSTLGNHDEAKSTSSISFIATHSSHVTENDIKEIDEELTKTVRDSKIKNIKPYVNTNYKYLVPLDNETQEKDLIKADTNDRKYTYPSSIRKYIHDWLEKQDVYDVPIQWLLLELEIRKICIERKCSFITYEEVLKISRDKKLGEDKFIRDGLRFHHLFGVLLYFEEVKEMSELIITDHQWLFNKLTGIVLYSFKNNYDTPSDCDDCEEKGIFKETMLDDLDISTDFEKCGIKNNPKIIFLRLLQHLRIIAPLNKDPTKYFMPSLLSSWDLDKVQEKIPGTNEFMIDHEVIEPFLIQFNSRDNTNLFPRGIFCFLVVQLIHSTKWELDTPAYGNLVSFIEKDTACFITLIDRIFCLEVQVTCDDEIGSKFVHDGIFIAVRDDIINAFAEVGSKLNIIVKLKYGFWCNRCEKHEKRHISLLEKQHISLLEGRGLCYCSANKPTELGRSHMVWFTPLKLHVQNSSVKQDDHLKGHPEMKQLREVMRIENINITTSWDELGLELLVSNNALAVIKANNPNNVTACCSEMFDKWLERTPEASWSQLVTALRKIKLYTAADVIIKHLKSGSIPQSEASGHGSIQKSELNDIIDFLNSYDSVDLREFGSIPVLINQLNYPDMKVQLAVLGALRNLSYGRLNDDNKISIASNSGLPQLLHLLRVSRTAQLRELVTEILWNLSSCEELKLRIIKNSLTDIVSYVLIPYSGWSQDLARNPIAQPSQIHWNAELRNSTGTLRNVSSAGEPARVFMRGCAGLVDALLWTIQSSVKRNDDIDNKTIENAVCILRNLSYRLENEIDPQEGADDVLDQEWEKEQWRELEEDIRIIQRSQRPHHRSWLPMCVRPSRSTLDDSNYNPSQFVREDAPLPRRHQPVFGIALLWQPEVVHPYLALIKSSSNPDTLEGACGAIHNLAACSWKWASYVRNVVRNSKGLPVIIALLEANHDPVIRAATTALRNLAIDPRNKAIIGEQAMDALTTRLPFGPRHIGLSDSTTIAILCALIELISESPQNAKLFRSRGGVLLAVKLARSKQHVPKIVFAANKLCSVLADYKEGYSALKREGWDISHYTRAAYTGYSIEFEPRGITTKDFRTSGHNKSSKKRKEKNYSKSSTSLADRTGLELPPSPVPSNATTNLGIERQSSPALNFEPSYDMVDSTRQKPTSQSVPNLGSMGTYAVIPENSAPSNDQQGSTDGHFDPNAVYAQVDKNKKRSTRRSSGKDDLPPAQHAPYPVDETAGGDSWV